MKLFDVLKYVSITAKIPDSDCVAFALHLENFDVSGQSGQLTMI